MLRPNESYRCVQISTTNDRFDMHSNNYVDIKLLENREDNRAGLSVYSIRGVRPDGYYTSLISNIRCVDNIMSITTRNSVYVFNIMLEDFNVDYDSYIEELDKEEVK